MKRHPPFLLVAFLLIALASPGTRADMNSEADCTTVDLTSQGGSLEQVSVRDQDGNGICYAYASASWIDAWIQKKNPKRSHLVRVSPVELALGVTYKNFPQAERLRDESGQPLCDAHNYALEHGVCKSEYVYEPEFHGRDSGSRNRYNSLLKTLSGPYARYWSQVSEGRGLTGRAKDIFGIDPEGRKKEIEERKAAAVDDVVCKMKTVERFSPKFVPSMESIQSYLERPTIMGYLRGMITDKCSTPGARINGKALGLPRCTEYGSSTSLPEEFKHFVDQKLRTKTDMPIPIGYCSEVLKEGPSYDPVRLGKYLPLGKFTCGRHASLIAGRRWNASKKVCEYRIRNSWGVDSFMYSKKWETSGADVWIAADSLFKSTVSLGDIK